MDIKSRKCKVITAWMAFFLSVSLLIRSAADGAMLAGGNWSDNVSIKDAFAQDYQDTERFQHFVSNYLVDLFLPMAAGEQVNWWYSEYSDDSYWEDYDGEVTESSLDAAAVVQDAVEGQYFGNGYDSGNYRASGKTVHNRIKDDKNIIYDIRQNGKTVYTNDENGILKDGADSLPSEYNFYLVFREGKAEITKDNSSVDVYGDGVYNEDSVWRIPGYKNFIVGDNKKKAEIRMAVSKKPVQYLKTDEDWGYNYEYGNLYDTYQSLKQARTDYMAMAVRFLAGLILLGVYLKLRKYKREGDRAIAGVTWKIWLECKIGLAVLILVTGIVGIFNCMDDMGFYYGWEYYEYTREMVTPYIASLMVNPFLLGMFFWLIYLLIIDYRYNRKSPKRTLVKAIQKYTRTKGLNYSFQKKMILKFKPVMISGIVLAGITLFINLVFVYVLYRMDSSGLAIFLVVVIPVLVTCILVEMIRQYAAANRTLAEELGGLMRQIEKVHNGNMTDKLEVPSDSELYEIAEQLNDIQKGMETALTERMKSERMKVELVSNVSHDIKTPLTSIISYVELMKQEEDLPEDVKDYVRILDVKSQRLKAMVQDVFEISKAASRQLPVNMEELDLGKLLRQTLADMEEQIAKSSVTVKNQIPAEAVMIYGDGSRLYRVFQNLLQNALKYSLDGSRVFITLKTEDKTARTTIKNISQKEIPADIDFTERFVRGDESRTDGGSGLGLSIARSFTEACGGTFRIEADADLFVVTVEFPCVSQGSHN